MKSTSFQHSLKYGRAVGIAPPNSADWALKRCWFSTLSLKQVRCMYAPAHGHRKKVSSMDISQIVVVFAGCKPALLCAPTLTVALTVCILSAAAPGGFEKVYGSLGRLQLCACKVSDFPC
jgi:hypothetical protein